MLHGEETVTRTAQGEAEPVNDRKRYRRMNAREKKEKQGIQIYTASREISRVDDG